MKCVTHPVVNNARLKQIRCICQISFRPFLELITNRPQPLWHISLQPDDGIEVKIKPDGEDRDLDGGTNQTFFCIVTNHPSRDDAITWISPYGQSVFLFNISMHVFSTFICVHQNGCLSRVGIEILF